MDNITDTTTRRLSFQIAALHQIYLGIRSAPVAVTETTREAASEALFKMLSPKNNPRSLDSTKFIEADELVLPTTQTISKSKDTHSSSNLVTEELALRQLEGDKSDALKSPASPHSNDVLALEIATEILELDESAISDKKAAIKKEALLLQWPAIYKRFMEEHKEYSYSQISS